MSRICSNQTGLFLICQAEVIFTLNWCVQSSMMYTWTSCKYTTFLMHTYFSLFNNSSPKECTWHCDDNESPLIAAGKLCGNDDVQNNTMIATHRAFLLAEDVTGVQMDGW